MTRTVRVYSLADETVSPDVFFHGGQLSGPMTHLVAKSTDKMADN